MDAGDILTTMTGLIGVVLGAILAFCGSLIFQRRADRAARRDHIERVTVETLSSAVELQVALASYGERWLSRMSRYSTGALALAELLACERWHLGALNAIRSMHQWQQTRNESAHYAIAAPLARLSTALVQASLVDNAGLRSASHDLKDAAGDLMQHHGDGEIEGLNRAIASFRKAANEALDSYQ